MALQAAGVSVSVEVQTRVHTLIMATEHTAASLAGDAALLVDIDLAILGAAPTRFAEYERQIRQQYVGAGGCVCGEAADCVAGLFGKARFTVRNFPIRGWKHKPARIS